MTCPAFAQGAARSIRQLPRPAVDAFVFFSDVLGAALVGSIFGATLGLPVLAVGLVVRALSANCDLVEGLQATARQAAFGCEVIIAMSTIATTLMALSIIGIPEAALMTGVIGAVGALRVVLGPLGAGRSPSLGALSALATSAAGVSGNADAQSAAGWLEQAVDVAAENPSRLPAAVRSRANDNDDRSENMATTVDPIFTWRTGQRPPGAETNMGLAREYSHAYQEAAEATYALDPTADLRPWLLIQTDADLAFMRSQLGLLTVTRTDWANAVRDAIGQLRNWATAGEAAPQGPWSRATMRRVLRSSSLQNNLPVEAPPTTEEGEERTEGGGGGGGAAAALGIAAGVGLLLSMK